MSDLKAIYPGNILGGSPLYQGFTLGGTVTDDPFVKADYPGLRAIRVNDTIILATALAASEVISTKGIYTPVWTALTTNPVIGNGSIEGFYSRSGNAVTGFFKIEMGTTTTFGSGAYRVSAPVAASAEYIDIPCVGFLTLHNPGVVRATWLVGLVGSLFQGTLHANEAWIQGAPVTLDGDSELIGTFSYLTDPLGVELLY